MSASSPFKMFTFPHAFQLDLNNFCWHLYLIMNKLPPGIIYIFPLIRLMLAMAHSPLFFSYSSRLWTSRFQGKTMSFICLIPFAFWLLKNKVFAINFIIILYAANTKWFLLFYWRTLKYQSWRRVNGMKTPLSLYTVCTLVEYIYK